MQYTPYGVLTIVTLALAGLALFNHYKGANQAYQANKQRYEQTKQAITSEVAAHRSYTGAQSYRQEWRDEQDLAAQQSMALSNQWMKWAAAISVALSSIGVTLLAYTLRYTKKAAESGERMIGEARATTAASRQAAQAALAANAHAERSTELQLRAYLEVFKLECPEYTEKIKARYIFFGVLIENIGKTPASNVWIRMEFRSPSPNHAFNDSKHESKWEAHGELDTISAGRREKVSIVCEPPKEIDATIRTIFCKVRVYYSDVFSSEHEREVERNYCAHNGWNFARMSVGGVTT
jgi:hypothetical protein